MVKAMQVQDAPTETDENWVIDAEVKRRMVAQGARVRDERKRAGLTIEELAKRTGLHSNTVGRIERGDSEASTDQVLRLAGALGVMPESLSAFPIAVSVATGNEDQGEFVLINELDVSAGAGGGRLNVHHEIIGRFAFSKAWLVKRGLRAEHCTIIRARGKSMADRINDGDILLVDTSVTHMLEDGVYVIERDGLDYVKLLQKDFVSGGVHIISYNPDYPAQFLDAGKSDELRISGRVVWHGGDV